MSDEELQAQLTACEAKRAKIHERMKQFREAKRYCPHWKWASWESEARALKSAIGELRDEAQRRQSANALDNAG